MTDRAREYRELLNSYREAISFNLYERPEEAELVKRKYGSVEAWIGRVKELEDEILKCMSGH